MADHDNKANNKDMGSEGIPTARLDSAAVGPGGKIGPYKLLRILGEGGYGIVYLAEQQRPVKRRVALKVIKPGMDTKQVIARFEAERQALALLDHPNIAHVFNAGTTDAGRPYFAMEYVKGVPITEHCDRHKLAIEERLKLFLAVCEAVQHAHQKAIIHRDIKPSNILIAYEGEQAVPMIIDFGVAKALTQSLTDRTLVTEQAQMIGTPEYMSPEQAEMTGQDIDTRTDIYSLGAVLYELLTGTLPFDSHTLREGGIEQMRRMIREQDPKTPSVRLSNIEKKESLSLANHRRTNIRTLGHRLHGELDWITLKAMDKDRMRRYQTAHALAEDIQRYLNQEPVLAGPPSTVYKIQKFIKRNRTLCISSVAVAAILILAVIISSHQALVAQMARKAESSARTTAETERDRARQAKRQAQENLYSSLVREARATRIARSTGYRDEVFSALKKARDLDVPQKDLADLRAEAIACLGDFVGLEPTALLELPEEPNAPQMWWAILHPTDPIAAFALTDGSVILKDLHSMKDIARFECKHPCTSLCFASSGNSLLSLHIPGDFPKDMQFDAAVVHLFVRAQDGTWVQGKTVEVPHAKWFMSTTAGFYITVADLASGKAHLMELLKGDIVYKLNFPVDMNHPPVIDLSADGRLLAAAAVDSAGSDKSVLDIRDITLDQHLIRLEPNLAAGTFLKFSPDGHYLAFLSRSGGFVYSTQNWEPVGHLTEQFTGNPEAIFLPDSTVLVYSLGWRFFLWDFEKKQYLATFKQPLGGVRWFSTSADGRALITYAEKRAWLYSLDVTAERLVLSGHTAGVPGISFSPDGSHLASVSKDRRLRVWNSTTGHIEWEREMEGQGQGISYSADGKWLITADYDRERVCIWNTETTEQIFKLGSERKIQTWQAELTDDNRYLVTATANPESGQGALTVWSCTIDNSRPPESRFEVLQLKSFSGHIKDIALAPDNLHLAFVGHKNWKGQELYQWDLTGTEEPRLLASNLRGVGAQMIDFTPDSRQMLVVDSNRFVVSYDVESGQKTASFPTLDADYTGRWAYSIMHKLSPDGTKLAIASVSNLGVDLWDHENGRLLYSLPKQDGIVYYFAWSPDGRRLAVSRSNGDIDIWNIAEIERVLSNLGLAP